MHKVLMNVVGNFHRFTQLFTTNLHRVYNKHRPLLNSACFSFSRSVHVALSTFYYSFLIVLVLYICPPIFISVLYDKLLDTPIPYNLGIPRLLATQLPYLVNRCRDYIHFSFCVCLLIIIII